MRFADCQLVFSLTLSNSFSHISPLANLQRRARTFSIPSLLAPAAQSVLCLTFAISSAFLDFLPPLMILPLPRLPSSWIWPSLAFAGKAVPASFARDDDGGDDARAGVRRGLPPAGTRSARPRWPCCKEGGKCLACKTKSRE